jgi:hypothetical protein
MHKTFDRQYPKNALLICWIVKKVPLIEYLIKAFTFTLIYYERLLQRQGKNALDTTVASETCGK